MNEHRQDPAYRGELESLSAGERSPAEIERDIERTRERMSSNIDALGEKLSPDNLKRQAKEAISEKAHGVVSNVGDQARMTGSRVIDFITENPLPVAAVTLGAIWLFTMRTRDRVSGDRMARYAYTGPERRQPDGRPSLGRRLADRAEMLKEKVSDAASQVGERAGELKDRVTETASHAGERVGDRATELGQGARERLERARGGFGRMVEENPLAIALGAAVIGVALGLLLPETEREREVMGPTRDQLADRVQATASRVKDAAVEAGREVKETVKQELEDRGPEIKSALKDAAATVSAQVKESATRVAEEAKQEAKGGGGRA